MLAAVLAAAAAASAPPIPFEEAWFLLEKEGTRPGVLRVRLSPDAGRFRAGAEAVLGEADGGRRIRAEAVLGADGAADELECWAEGAHPFYVEAVRDGDGCRPIPGEGAVRGLSLSWLLPAHAAFVRDGAGGGDLPFSFWDAAGPGARAEAAAWRPAPDGAPAVVVGGRGFGGGASGLSFPVAGRVARPATRDEADRARGALEAEAARIAAERRARGERLRTAWAERAKRALGSGATEHQNEHFLVLTDLGPSRGAAIPALLETLYRQAAPALGLEDRDFLADGPCVAVFLSSEGSFNNLRAMERGGVELLCARSWFEEDFRFHQDAESPFSRIVVYLPPARGAPRTLPAIQAPLLHELGHAILDRAAPRGAVPGWLHEGISQRLEYAAGSDPAATLPSNEAADRWLKEEARRDRLPPLQKLLAAGSFAPEDLPSYYLSFGFVRFLERRDPARFRAFLSLVRRGCEASRAVEKAYGASPEGLEQEFQTHLKELP